MNDLLPLSALKRLLDAPPTADRGASCRRCGTLLSDDHRHIADVERRALDCVCATCHAFAALSPDTGDSHRAVPRRCLRLPDAAISDEQWSALDIPVGIVFFFHNSALNRTVASYPSPAGATESLLPADARERLLSASPWLPTIAPDVEALLVRRTPDAHDCFIVPVDACYELVGRIRRRWTGFGGGPEVREEIESFFATLRDKGDPVAP
jgi:hypothetical protein